MSRDGVAEGWRRLAGGDFGGAAEVAAARVDAEPTDASAWRLLARVAVMGGRANEAVTALRRAAALEALPPDAEGDLAAGMLMLGDLDAARWHIDRAIAAAPEDGVLWRRRAVIAERRRDDEEAERAYAEALRLQPGDAASHNNHGVFLRRKGRLGQAIEALRRAVLLDPARAEFQINLAAALRAAGDHPGAIDAYRMAVMSLPDKEDLRLSLIGTLREAGLHDEAIVTASEASTHLPRSAPIHVARSAVLLDGGKVEPAIAAARAALALRGDDPDAMLHLGNALGRAGDRAGAIDSYRRALARRADDAQVLANLAIALDADGALDEARVLADRAATAAPRHAEVLVAAGVVAQNGGDLATAETRFRDALAQRPDYHEAAYDLGWLQLSRGILVEGQQGFDRRWRLPRFAIWRRPFSLPLWDGGPLAGRRLLVWGDHGPGDEILYARMIPALAARAGAVIVECAPRLVPLFRRSFPGVTVVARGDPPDPAVAGADLQCPSGSVLGRLCPSIEALAALPVAPLRPDPDAVAAIRRRYAAEAGARLLVGVSWRSAHPEIAREKSLPLEAWSPILESEECRFVSVQYGSHEGEIEAAAAATGATIAQDRTIDPLVDLDLAAAQVAALDLVISVSNTAAHLAAAVGTPTWCLLGEGRGLFWYWFRSRRDSPWYPSARLYRQPSPGSWAPVVEEVAAALATRTRGAAKTR